MRKIVLSVFTALMLCFQVSAQSQRVTGTVTDPEGAPLIGVAVVVKGTNTAVVTNVDGTYAINVPANAVLVFSHLGMETHETSVGSRTTINVQMRADALLLEDVVVTAAGINRAERSLGYSVSRVNTDEAIQKAEPDMLRALDGKIPGVVVSSPSGAAGGATKVTIRGNSSFFGNNQPLYVVDGVPYSNLETSTSNQGSDGGGNYGSGISTLDPNDIESMSVLKSAAAAALYGSRAANGVVLITTKSGSQKTKSRKGLEITFNGSYTIETVGALPDYQNKFGQGSEFQYSGANGSWGAPFSAIESIPFQDYYADIYSYYPDWAMETYGTNDIPYQAYPNNVKDLFDVGGVWEGGLSVQSANDKGLFSFTASRMKQDGYVPNSAFERFSIAAGGHQQLDNGFRVGANVSFSRSIQDGSMYGNNQTADGAGVNAMARAFIMPRNWDIQNMPWQTPDGGNLLAQLSTQANNPYWAWNNNTIKTTMDRTVANFKLGYDFTSWLSADYTFGFNSYRMDRKEIINIGSRNMIGGRITTDNLIMDELESTLLLSGGYDFTPDFGINVVLGHNVNQQTIVRTVLRGIDIDAPGIFSIANTKSLSVASDSYTRSRLWGIFGDITLNYKQWAFLNLTGRNDFSSTLPKDSRSYFYPSVSGSIVFTEAFGIVSDVLDFGKFRASWGRVGNDASPYAKNGFYYVGDPFMGQGMMFAPTTYYDPNLKPEFTSEVELGLDMSFFRGRLGFDFSIYTRNSTNQIAALRQPQSSGYTSLYTNFGKLRNRGFELGINAIPVQTKNFKWDLFGTFTLNRSEVLELKDGYDELRLASTFSPGPFLLVGQPYGIMKGSVAAKDEEGNYLVDPNNGVYFPSAKEGIVGDPNPKFKTSLINNFSYKGFTLGVMVDYQHGGCVATSTLTDLLGRGVTKDTEDRYGGRVLPGVLGDRNSETALVDGSGNKIKNYIYINEADLWFVSSSSNTSFAINGVDEFSVYDATTFRLREISLGYTFPKKWFEKVGIGSLHLSFVARNLWFYSPNVPKHTNYDPTANAYGGSNAQGYDYTGIPLPRRYGFNISITF